MITREKGYRRVVRVPEHAHAKRSMGVCMLLLGVAPLTSTTFGATQQEAADYVRDHVLGGSFGTVTLWMTETALTGELSGSTVHLARSIHTEELFPFPLTWLAMIDDEPEANWAHPCRWVFIEEDVSTGELIPDRFIVVNTDWFPTVWRNQGLGSEVDFGCVPVTDTECAGLSVLLPRAILGPGGPEGVLDKDCLYAVLISGGWKKGKCVKARCVGGANNSNPCTKPSDCPGPGVTSCGLFVGSGDACDSVVDCTAPDNYCYGTKNFDRYKTNLVSMYRKLRACGFPADQIYTYYDNGDGLDLDNADGDGNPRTGASEVSGTATEANIRTANTPTKKGIATLCDDLDPDRDVLVIYTSNHGGTTVCSSGINAGKPCKADGACPADPGTCTAGRCVGGRKAKSACANNGQCASPAGICVGRKGVVLWDFDSDGRLDDNESYDTDEFAADTADCKVCRLFVIMDQCHSGQFTSIATDGDHANAAIYAAAQQDEPSWGREYMARWETKDLATTTVNDMHQDVVDNGNLRSTPSKAEGTAKNGDTSLCVCWEHDPHATAEGTQGTSSYDFGDGLGDTSPPIPADFFGPGSDPFEGHIELRGDPFDPGTMGNASTEICRGGAPLLPDDEVGSFGTVTIEIVELSLVATQPIRVTFNGGQNPEQWDVRVGLSEVPAPMGELTATKTHANGGTFDTMLLVQPKFTFTKVSNPAQRMVLDTGIEGIAPIDFSSTRTPFVHSVDPSLGVIAPSDGSFVPGVEETVPGIPSSQVVVPTIEDDPETPAQHTVVPASTFCGNNVREVGEQCDGADDAKCPGNCLPQGDPNECTCVPGTKIPAVSDWGLSVMLLLVLTAGTVVLGRRRFTAA